LFFPEKGLHRIYGSRTIHTPRDVEKKGNGTGGRSGRFLSKRRAATTWGERIDVIHRANLLSSSGGKKGGNRPGPPGQEKGKTGSAWAKGHQREKEGTYSALDRGGKNRPFLVFNPQKKLEVEAMRRGKNRARERAGRRRLEKKEGAHQCGRIETTSKVPKRLGEGTLSCTEKKPGKHPP